MLRLRTKHMKSRVCAEVRPSIQTHQTALSPDDVTSTRTLDSLCFVGKPSISVFILGCPLLHCRAAPHPTQAEYPHLPTADDAFDLHLNRYISIREDHRGNEAHPSTEIVAIEIGEEKIQGFKQLGLLCDCLN